MATIYYYHGKVARLLDFCALMNRMLCSSLGLLGTLPGSIEPLGYGNLHFSRHKRDHRVKSKGIISARIKKSESVIRATGSPHEIMDHTILVRARQGQNCGVKKGQ